PTDDFTSLGDGGSESYYLRIIEGQFREMNWVSYYGIWDVNYKEKYYLNASLSYDGLSLLSEKRRYNFFPSVIGAWRLSSEKPLLGSSIIEDLKLTAGWSNSGNLFSSVYDNSRLYYTSVRIGKYGVPVRETIPNEDLELEKKTTVHGGIDASLFRQGLNLRATYFLSNVNNLIIPQTLDSYYGFTEYYNNGGVIQNSGIELFAETKFSVGEIKFLFQAVVNTLNQEIKELDFLQADQTKLITQVNAIEVVNQRVNRLNSFYGYKTNGVYQSNTSVIGPNGTFMQEGDIAYVDVDGNNIINDLDKMDIGNPSPDLYGGFQGSIQYRRIGIDFNLKFSQGNDIFNYSKWVMESMSDLANQGTDVINRWNYNGQNELPRYASGDPSGNNEFSDRWIEDGSYLKLKDLSISYNMPIIGNIYKKLNCVRQCFQFAHGDKI
ncbi:MAG: hypothetical protein HC906_05825, partial [Bacteroidales bacterium]|nr:hypothetical protein [Bacteroidales bacterium]